MVKFHFMFPRLGLTLERWKWSNTYGCYVSTKGRIKDEHRKIIPFYKNVGGYYIVKCKTGNRCVHRIVAETFVPVSDIGLTVDHIDGNKLNNALSNLQWVSEAENTKRAAEMMVKEDKKSKKVAADISKYPIKFFVVNDKMVSIHHLEETFRSEIKRANMCDNDFKMKNLIQAYLRLARRHYEIKEENPVNMFYGQVIALKF